MESETLSTKKCVPCEGFEEPLDREAADGLVQKIAGWQLTDDSKAIFRDYVRKNFIDAVDFINKIKDIAESENHHPDIHLTGYKKLKIDLSTHAIGGLSLNDFILAAKINELDS